jgi:phosphomannomutase
MNYLFDVDGTLTPNRLPMVKEFEEQFLKFCLTHKVYLVSGSDYKKLQEQLSERILKACQAVFSCSGNETYIGGEMVANNVWNPPENLLNSLQALIESSKSPVKAGQHIEIRNGMVNFSTVGRNCTQEQRLSYVEWEKPSEERRKLIDTVLAPVFKDLQFDTGGQISIDIYPKGTGKEQVLKELKGPVHFFGDRIGKGGNDRNIAFASLDIPGSSVSHVESWEQTRDLLKKLTM